MIEWLLVLVSYLMGSISNAIIVCSLMGLNDPRQVESKNPGATNVMRIAGKKAAIITLLGDVLKGLIPVLIAKVLEFDSLLLSIVAFSAFLGHLYPIFFEFKGGKGVATSFGVICGVDWFLGVVIATSWCFIYKMSKISSLSAIATAILTPFYVWFVVGDKYLLSTFILITVILLYKHKDNMKRLWIGEER